VLDQTGAANKRVCKIWHKRNKIIMSPFASVKRGFWCSHVGKFGFLFNTVNVKVSVNRRGLLSKTAKNIYHCPIMDFFSNIF
jgi:hypothetical protein